MVSAGDVERFVYCAHNWQLARTGIDPGGAGAERGIIAHQDAGRSLRWIRRNDDDSRRAWRWMFRILLVVASVAFLAIEAAVFQATVLGIVLITLALLLVSAAAGLMTLAALAEGRASHACQAANIQHGAVIAGPAGEGPLLEDPSTGLRGAPDYILETQQGFVPVELKSGRTPDTPYASHVLQLACYLRLVEANTGQAPAHGLLTYPDGTFPIAWDAELRGRLDATLERIQQAEATGRADRDHGDVGRCRGCARRDGCTQRLL